MEKKEIIIDILQNENIDYPNHLSIHEIKRLKKELPVNPLSSTILFLFMMSLPNYNFRSFIWFINSKLYLRKGFSYKYTIAILIKMLRPNKLQKFNLSLLSSN